MVLSHPSISSPLADDEALLQRTIELQLNASPENRPERGWRTDWAAAHLSPPAEQIHRATQRTNAQVVADRESRIRAHAQRVHAELTAGKKRRLYRGRRCPIVCLTDVDALTGGLRVFPSATAAGVSIRRCPDNVIQAINRNGTCGGHRYQYLDELQGELGKTVDSRTVFIPTKVPVASLSGGTIVAADGTDPRRPLKVKTTRSKQQPLVDSPDGDKPMEEKKMDAHERMIAVWDRIDRHNANVTGILEAIIANAPSETERLAVPPDAHAAMVERIQQAAHQLELAMDEQSHWLGRMQRAMADLKSAGRAQLAGRGRMCLDVSPGVGNAVAGVADLVRQRGSLADVQSAVVEAQGQIKPKEIDQ